MVRIAPSLLSADFAHFAQAVADCEEGGADALHFDVMDGQFVPNITYGAHLLRALAPRTQLPCDVHLMVADPDRFVPEFAEAGAHTIAVHAEASRHLQRSLALIRACGARAGVALNPATPLGALEYVLDDVDRVLVMTVNPGFSGQAFIPASIGKLRGLRQMLDEHGGAIEVAVDGGVSAANAAQLAGLGVTFMVAGSSAFGHPLGVAAGIGAIRAGLEGA